MKKILIKKLHTYINQNNPEILAEFNEANSLSSYLFNKIESVEHLINQTKKGQPEYIIIDNCMQALTKDLKPSKFNYICNVLEEDFEDVNEQLRESGILNLEVINLINYCMSVFEDLVFNQENESNRFLRYTIISCIREYLESNTVDMKNKRYNLQKVVKITE